MPYLRPMVFEHNDYRTYLKATLAERAEKRDGYSLRAFSQKIGVSSSFLSEVLGRKKSLSVEVAFKIAVKLELNDAESQYFCLLTQYEQEEDPQFREEILRRLTALNPHRKPQDLSVDLFKMISDWYHTAILELSYLRGFRFEAEYIADKLGITKNEADLAIERLERLELIEKDEKGKYRKAHSQLLIESKIPNTALKNFHRQILEKAIESLDTQGPRERMSASDVLPIDSKYLPEVQRLSEQFSTAVMELSRKSEHRDAVYALATQFFNLTPGNKS